MRWGVCILGSQFAMEQRHKTRVMFSAVVHQSRTVTAAVKKKEYIEGSLFTDDDQGEQEIGGDGQGLCRGLVGEGKGGHGNTQRS
jgi:hypothetical protein